MLRPNNPDADREYKDDDSRKEPLRKLDDTAEGDDWPEPEGGF